MKLLKEVDGGVLDWVDDIDVDGFVLGDDELYNDKDNDDTEIVIEGRIDEFLLVDEELLWRRAIGFGHCSLGSNLCFAPGF